MKKKTKPTKLDKALNEAFVKQNPKIFYKEAQKELYPKKRADRPVIPKI